MQFFGGKENEVAVDGTPRRRSFKVARNFGTPLATTNSNRTTTPVRNNNSSVKKVVRVRRTPQSSMSESVRTKSILATKTDLSTGTLNEKMVVIDPGPVGLQLEPVNENPVYGCRVVRFVDGGPKCPGQARKSGKIQPGDWVLKVEAEGNLMAATTYEEIVDLLKHTHIKRTLTVKSMWDINHSRNSFEENVTQSGTKQETSTDFIPTKRIAASKMMPQCNRVTPGLSAHVLPSSIPTVLEGDEINPPTNECNNLHFVKSPSDMIFVSHSMEDLSRTSTGSPVTTFANNGPVIVPIQNIPHNAETGNKAVHNHRDDPGTPKEEDSVLRSRSMSEDFEDAITRSRSVSDGEDSITRSRTPSMYSQQTTRSSQYDADMAPQALADQFLLIDGYGVWGPESPYLSHSQSLETATGEESTSVSGEGNEGLTTPVHMLSYSPHNPRMCDSLQSQLLCHQELLDQSLMRADFEQRLQAARNEHQKMERELKELYIQTCDRNEVKIRDLQASNSRLRKKAESLHSDNELLRQEASSREMELEMSQTMVKELETRLLSIESDHDKLAVRFNDASDSIQHLENSLEKKVEEASLQKQVMKSLRDQLGHTQTQLSHKIVELEVATENSMRVKDRLCGAEGRAQKCQGELEEVLETVRKVEEENNDLKGRLAVVEKQRQESQTLADALSKTVEENQKALSAGRSTVDGLETENRSLAKQIADKNKEFEQLLQDKLKMENKLVETWKDYQQAKTDASTVHDTLMDKLENGEFCSTSDILEKQYQLDTAKAKVQSLNAHSIEQNTKLLKKSLNLHVRLRFLETEIRHVKQAKNAACYERDELQRGLEKIKDFTLQARDHVDIVKGEFRMEHREKLDLQAQIVRVEHERDQAGILLQSRTETMSAEIQISKRRIEALIKAKDDSDRKLELSCRKLNEHVESATAQLQTARRNLEVTKQECALVRGAKENLQKELDLLRSKHDAAEGSCKQTALEIQELKDMVFSAERTHDFLAQKLRQSESAEDAMSQMYHTLVKEKKQVELELTSKIACLESEIESLRFAAECSKSDFETMQARTGLLTNELQLQVQTLNHDLQEKEAQLKRSVCLIKDIEEARDTNIQETIEAQAKIELFLFRIEQSQHSYQTHLSMLQSEICVKNTELESERSKYGTLQLQIPTIKAELERKYAFLDSSREEAETEYKKEIVALREEINATIHDFEMKQAAWKAKEINFLNEIKRIKSEESHKVLKHRQEITNLQKELQSALKRADKSFAELKEFENNGAGLEVINQLRCQLNKLTKEADEVAIVYWENSQELTAQLQSKDELLLCAESRMKDLEEDLDTLQQNTRALQDDENRARFQLEEALSQIDSQALILKSFKSQCLKLDEANTELRALQRDLEVQLSEESAENRFLEESVDCLNMENEKLRNELKHAHQELANLRIELEEKLPYVVEPEALLFELAHKTQELQQQSSKTACLHEEISSLISVVDRLQTDMDNLRASLVSERSGAEQAMADLRDSKLELSIQHTKLSTHISSIKKALDISEVSRSKIAKSLLQANATIASLKVQLKTRCNQENELHQIRSVCDDTREKVSYYKERAAFLECALKDRDNEFVNQTIKLNKYAEKLNNALRELDDKEQENNLLREDLKFTKLETMELQDSVAELESLRLTLEAKTQQISELQTDFRRAEVFVQEASDSLETAQQSEEDLRHKFSCLRKSLRVEISKLSRIQGTHPHQSEIPGAPSSPEKELECSLEYELTAITREIESLSVLVDKRSADFDGLHESITKLASKLTKIEVCSKLSEEKSESLLLTLASQESNNQSLKAKYDDQILKLQKLVLATRASCVAVQVRNRNLQKTVTVEKKVLLKNIESLSASLLSMQDHQHTSNSNHQALVDSLQKMILKSRAEYIAKHFACRKLAVNNLRLHEDQITMTNVLNVGTVELSVLKEKLFRSESDLEKLVSAGRDMGNVLADYLDQIECSASQLRLLEQDLLLKNDLLSKVTAEKETVEREKDCLIQTNIRLQEESGRLNASLLEKNTHVNGLNDLIRLLRDRFAEKEKRCLQLSDDNLIMKATINELHDDLTATRMCLTGTHEKTHQKEQRILQLESESNARRRRNDLLQKNLFAAAESRAELEWKIEQLCAKVEVDDLEHFWTRTSWLALLLDKSQMNQAVNTLEMTVATRTEENLEMERTLKHRETEVSCLESKIRAKDVLEEEHRNVIIALANLGIALESEKQNSNNLHAKIRRCEDLREDAIKQVEMLQKELAESKMDLETVTKKSLQVDSDHWHHVRQLEADIAIHQERLLIVEQDAENSLEIARHLKEENAQLLDKIGDLQTRTHFMDSQLSRTDVLEEELKRRAIQAAQQERQLVDLEEIIDRLNRDSAKQDELLETKEQELNRSHMGMLDRDSRIAVLEQKIRKLSSNVGCLNQTFQDGEVEQSMEASDDMKKHVDAVKDAFKKQSALMEDLKLSETVLSNFMNEVMRLANKSEREALELSSTLNSVEDLLIRPSSCLASLDLAGIGVANEYVEQVRSRLEEMATLAYNTSVELKVRQNEFDHWKSTRQSPPSVPITPPPKPVKRAVFDKEPSKNIGENQIHLAGAMLLNSTLEKRSKMELASAFRRWSCCAGAISASCRHKDTAVALAKQLDQTREKLLLLKSHLKVKSQKPRLRRILERLDGKNDNGQEELQESFDL